MRTSGSFETARKNLLDGERGTVIKSGAEINVALIFANSYFVAMSNLGFQQVYRLLNQRRDVRCERFFASLDRRFDPKEIREVKSLESSSRLGAFDVWAFAIPFELDYAHMAAIIIDSGVPLRTVDRDDRHPLIMAGGIGPTTNPEPIAPFTDFVYVGEAESGLDQVFDSYHPDKKTWLKSLSELPHIYVPGNWNSSGYEVKREQSGRIDTSIPSNPVIIGDQESKVSHCFLKPFRTDSLEDEPVASTLMTPETEFGDSYLIEVGRGCPFRCKFCLVGYRFGKVRWQSYDWIAEKIRSEGLSARGGLGLISSAVADHPRIDDICQTAVEAGVPVSFSSLRAEKVTDSMINLLKHSGQRQLTLAPEAGLYETRKRLLKNIKDEVFFEKSELAISMGLNNLKYYFVFGIPGETQDDLDGIVNFAMKVRGILAARAKTSKVMGRVILSCMPFIPKPLTPWARSPMPAVKEIRDKSAYLRKKVISAGNIKIDFGSGRLALAQGIVAVGGRKTSGLIEAVASSGGWSTQLIREHYPDYTRLFEQRDYEIMD
jgi:radical SAM superfamily enzyme YgiQ (UPF0313 family)